MQDIDQYHAVTTMQTYINEHLNDPITLHDLAKVSGYSMWHAGRIFKRLTGKTSFAYIRSLRLSKAALTLRDNHTQPIIDVAFDFVFDSHEGFTRAFSKQFGMTPKTYKQTAPPLTLFMPNHVMDYYLYLHQPKKENKMDQPIVFTQVVKKPKRNLILKRGETASDYFQYCEEVSCDVWGVLTSIKEALLEPAGYTLPESLQAGKSAYVQGVEVPLDYNKPLPEGFEMITLDEAYYLIFQGEPYEDEELNFMAAISALRKAIKKFNPTVYGYAFDESVLRFQLEPQGYRGYIEAIGVTPIKKQTF